MNNQEVEAEIQAKGLTAPRITEGDVNAVIIKSEYHVFPGSQPPIVSAMTENLDRSTDGIAESIEAATTKLY